MLAAVDDGSRMATATQALQVLINISLKVAADSRQRDVRAQQCAECCQPTAGSVKERHGVRIDVALRLYPSCLGYRCVASAGDVSSGIISMLPAT
jgi:hypothetical protein